MARSTKNVPPFAAGKGDGLPENLTIEDFGWPGHGGKLSDRDTNRFLHAAFGPPAWLRDIAYAIALRFPSRRKESAVVRANKVVRILLGDSVQTGSPGPGRDGETNLVLESMARTYFAKIVADSGKKPSVPNCFKEAAREVGWNVTKKRSRKKSVLAQFEKNLDVLLTVASFGEERREYQAKKQDIAAVIDALARLGLAKREV
jgi:hypothetical protein